MSGGHFGYDQYRISQIRDAIGFAIDEGRYTGFDNMEHEAWPEPIRDRFRLTMAVLDAGFHMAHRIDWLLSDDDGEEQFLKRWEKDVEAVMKDVLTMYSKLV